MIASALLLPRKDVRCPTSERMMPQLLPPLSLSSSTAAQENRTRIKNRAQEQYPMEGCGPVAATAVGLAFIVC